MQNSTMADKGGTHSDSENSAQEQTGFAAKLRQELDLRHAYIPLLACCFLSGLTDGTIYNAYGTFVSMQTGNTIFVALGTTGFNNKPYGWARSLCSIAFFVFGSFMFARLYLFLGGKRRGTLLLSFIFQAVCVFIACAIAERGVVDPSYPKKDPLEVNFKELIMVALLSFQAAGQIVSSRSLQVGEVPTVVVTSMLCDLVSDPALFTLGKNDKRNRRAIAFVLTLVGAICGGWISKASGNITPSLWLVGGIKVVLGGVWLLWKKKEQQKEVV